MTVYQGLLQRRIELYLSGTWVDFSSRLLTRTLSPNPGRTSGSSDVTPSSISFDLDNPTGDITPYRADSAYFPYVDVGMLVRYSVYWSGAWYVRGVFEATDVEPYWPYGDLSDGTTTGEPGESYVAISAADILQRLSDDEQPLRSPMYRTMAGVAADDYQPHVYWPMEDGSGTTRFASGVTDGVAATITGTSSPAAFADLPGSEPLPTFSAGAQVLAAIPTYSDTDQWVTQFVTNVPSAPSSAALLGEWRTPGGTVGTWRLYLEPGSPDSLYVRAFNSSGTEVYNLSTGVDSGDLDLESDFYGSTFMLTVANYQTGANTQTWLKGKRLDGLNIESASSLNAATTTALAGPARLVSPVDGTMFGHWAFYTDPNFDVTFAGSAADVNAAAMDGYVGERSGRRLERLSREEGISFTSSGDLDETTAMGPQPIDTLITALRDCRDADLGILHAQRQANGLHYRTRTDLYNQTAVLTLDAAQDEVANPFRPSATSKYIVNDVTVNRPDGSRAQAVDQDSIDKVGKRGREYDANTETDDDVVQVAGWLLNLGTPGGMRYPSVSTELTIATQNIPDWLALNLGDRIEVVNLPPQHPAGTVDLLVDGYVEPHSPSRWTPQINCSPAEPWDVAVLDDDDLGKLDTAGCLLQAPATSGATSLTVATTVLPRWTTDAGEMPIPILVSGQVNSVTAIANVSPSFVAAGTVAHGTNASVSPSLPAGVQAGDLLLVWAAIRNSGTGTVDTPSGYTQLLASGNVALLAKLHTGTESAPTITFTGGVANADTSAQMAAFRGVGITVHDYEVQLNGSSQDIAYPQLDVSRDNCLVLYLGWKQDDWTSVATLAGATEIGEPDTTTGDDQGIVWDYVQQTTAARIASGSFTVTGGASTISRGAVIALATDVQTMTVTRGTNGVTKALSIGDQVNVYRPARLAL